MVFGDAVSTLDVCIDFEPCFKLHNLVSAYPIKMFTLLKSIKLHQMTHLNVNFYVAVSVYRMVKLWNSPQFPALFRNGLLGVSAVDAVNFILKMFPFEIWFF